MVKLTNELSENVTMGYRRRSCSDEWQSWKGGVVVWCEGGGRAARVRGQGQGLTSDI